MTSTSKSPRNSDTWRPAGYRFDSYVYTLDSKELRRGTEAIALQRQPARALELLLERAGDVVSRADLRRHLWGDEQFVDYEQGINFTIRKIRIALGDAPSAPTYLETLPRRGYRFLAPVQAIEPLGDDLPASPPIASPPQPAPIAPESTPPRRLFARHLGHIPATRVVAAALVTAVLIAVVLVAAVWVHGTLLRGRGAVGDIAVATPTRLAIAPLATESDLDDEAMAVVIGEELTSHLTHTFGERLEVIGMRPMRGVELHEDVWREALAKTEASHVLRGTVSLLEEGSRIALRLVRLEDNVSLWAQTFEPRFHQRNRDFDEAAWQIASALGVQPNISRRRVEEELPPEVERSYSRALYLLSTRHPEHILGGVALLLEVCEEAPNLARAHTELARAYLLMTRFFSEVHWHQIERVARRAIELDDSSAEAHLALATALFRGRLEWHEAELEFERALELSSNWTPTLTEYALYLSARGRHDEARDVAARAVELDRFSDSTLSTKVLVDYFGRRHTDAAATADQLLELFPSNRVGSLYGPLARIELGDDAAALEGFQRFLRFSEHGEPPTSLEGVYETFLRQWRKQAKAKHSYYSFQAAWLSMLGETDQALLHLQWACESEVDWLLPFVGVSPMFDPVRDHPDYGSLADCLAPATTLSH